jgi:hypothetical protein
MEVAEGPSSEMAASDTLVGRSAREVRDDPALADQAFKIVRASGSKF